MQVALKNGLMFLTVVASLGVLSCQSTDDWSSSNTASTTEQKSVESAKQELAKAPVTKAPVAKAPVDKPAKAKAVPASAKITKRAGMTTAFMAFPTGDVNTSAILVENFTPEEVSVGQMFETETAVTNLTSLTLENVVLSQVNYGELAAKTSTPKANVAGNNTSWNLGSIGPNETRTIRTTGSAAKAQSLSSCMSVTYASTLCIDIPVVEPKLTLVATGPESAGSCDDIFYEYVVSNPGSGSAKDVVVMGTLPEGMTSNNSKTFSKTIGTLEPNKSKSFKIKVETDRTGKFQHVATANAQDGLEAKSGTVATVISKPKLAITKTGSETSFVGRDATYQITVKNIGDGISNDTVLEDIIPAGAEYRSSTEGGKLASNRVRWNLGSLKPNETRKVSVRLQLPNIGSFVNRATAKGYCADQVDASVTTVVKGIPAILLEVVDVEDPIVVGEDETYIVTVTNQGTAPATNVKISVTIPENTTFVRTSGITKGPFAGSLSRSFTFAPLASLAPKKTVSWKIVVRGDKAADARFRVAMNSDQLTSSVDETEATNFYE